MRSGYSYLDGMQELLHTLAADDFEIHAFTNYPIWFPSNAFHLEIIHSFKRSFMSVSLLLSFFHRYNIIEDKLKLSAYLSWTFCSCISGTTHISCLSLLLIVSHIQTVLLMCFYLSGKRKPDPDFYLEVVGHLGVEPCHCIFIDDRLEHVCI